MKPAARLVCSALFGSGVLFTGQVRAEPGTHAPAISTWDTRASTLEFGYRQGFLSGGHFDILSYNANFSATTGNLSSQFGVHYLNVRPAENVKVLHGLSATAIALFSIPVSDRYQNGVPKGAVGIYFGVAPSALVNGRASYVSIPFLLGVGAPWSPSKGVTIAPWVEVSPGVNVDTKIRNTTLDASDITGTPTGNSVTLTDAQINHILDKTVDFHASVTASMRAGLDLEFKLSDSVAFDVSGMLGTLGTAFQGTLVSWVGAGLVFRWDAVVPAVLPADQRLLREDCASIEQRYNACQAAHYATEPRPPVLYSQQPAVIAPAPRPPQTPSVTAPPPASPVQPYPAPPSPPPAVPAPPPPAPDPAASGTSTVPTTGFPMP
jgi:hypothetical protein